MFSRRAGINSGEEKKGEDIVQSTKKESENSEISMASSRNPYLNGNNSNPNKTEVFKIKKSILKTITNQKPYLF